MTTPRITDMKVIECTSALSSAKPGTGFVSVRTQDTDSNVVIGQVDVPTARQIGMQFLEAAEAAEHDAALFSYLTSDGDGQDTALQIIAQLRNFREGQA